MITAKYILENEAGERFDLTAPANIFLVNVEGLGITTNVTYGDLENGFFHTLYEQTPQNNITGDLVYQNAAYDNYQTLVNWIIKAKTLYFCYQPLETEYRRIVKLNYIVKERRTAGGWMRAGISFAPLTPWYLAQPTEIGMGGIEEELFKGYFQDGEASPTIEPVQDLHGYDYPWPGGGGKNLFPSSDYWEDGGINTSGQDIAGNLKRTKGFYPITGGADYVTSGYTVSSASDFRIFFYDSAQNYLSYKQGNRITFTAPSNAAYFRCRWAASADMSEAQLEVGSTATAFEPYENICPITPGLTLVRDDESTLEVYGGTLDAATGVLTVTHNAVALNGTETWNHATLSGLHTFNMTLSDAPMPTTAQIGGYAGLCDTFPVDTYDWMASGASLTDNTLRISAYRLTSSRPSILIAKNDITAAADFKTWLASNPVTVIYPLATPVTYQLTEAEVNRALEALGVSYGYRYTADLRYGGDAAVTMSATIAPSGHVPAAVVLRYTGAITNPRVRLVGAETGIVYGICAINTSLTSGQTVELSTRYEDSHVMLIDGDGTESSLLGYVNQAYETYFRCPTTESAVLTIESDNAFSGEATLLVYTYFWSV